MPRCTVLRVPVSRRSAVSGSDSRNARSTVHRGMARALEQLIDLERGRGGFEARLDTPTLAYAILRISESFLYADVIADRAPDVDRAITLIEALLSGLDVAAARQSAAV